MAGNQCEEEVVGRIRVSSVVGSALAIINDRKNGMWENGREPVRRKMLTVTEPLGCFSEVSISAFKANIGLCIRHLCSGNGNVQQSTSQSNSSSDGFWSPA